MSKTRVTPPKTITLPMFELLDAHTAAKSAFYLKELFKISGKNIFYFSDSQIVLNWVKGSTSNWKHFVANYVCEIEDLVVPSQWKVCKEIENLANFVSCGYTASELIKNDVCQSKGLAWMKKILEMMDELDDEDILKEQCKAVVCSLNSKKCRI